MQEKWQNLLSKLEIFQWGQEKSFWKKEDIEIFEQNENIILPEEYKNFCQIFGRGYFGIPGWLYSMLINSPDYELYQLYKENFSSYILIFGTLGDDYLFGWDLRTYSHLDKSYDIFIVDKHDERCGYDKIGRNFYYFVRDFCLGGKMPELPPESIDYLPEIFIHTFETFVDFDLELNYYDSLVLTVIKNDRIIENLSNQDKALYHDCYLHDFFNLPKNNSSIDLSDNVYKNDEKHFLERQEAIRNKNFYAFFRYLKTFRGHLEPVFTIKFSPDSKNLISAGLDKTIKIHNVITEQEVFTLKGHNRAVLALSISPDGNILASGSTDNTIKLWNLKTGEEIRTLLGHSGAVLSLAISPDNRTLVSSSTDKTIKIWNLNTGQVINTLIGHTESVLSIVISPDGKTLASGSADSTFKIWDLSTGQEIYTLQKKSGIVFSLDFHPSKQILISGHGDETIKIWDLTSFEIIRTITVHKVVSSLMISPDGENIACGYHLGFAWGSCIWELATGKLITQFGNDYNKDYPFINDYNGLINHYYAVYSVAFSPDGKQLATGSKDTTVKLWGIPPSLEYIE